MSTIDAGGKPPVRTMRDIWRVLLVEGIVLMLLGAGALVIPVIASLAAAIILGWLFLAGGLVGLYTTLVGRHAPGYGWALVSSIVTIAAGVLLLGWPLTGAVSITLVLAGYLAVDGVVSILYGISHRNRMTRHWAWLVVNGLLDIVMAFVIVSILSGAAFWLLGVLIGIDFVFGGAALVAIALAARHSEHIEAPFVSDTTLR